MGFQISSPPCRNFRCTAFGAFSSPSLRTAPSAEHNRSQETVATHKGFCCRQNDMTQFFRKATARQRIRNYISGAAALCLLQLVPGRWDGGGGARTQGQFKDNVTTNLHRNKWFTREGLAVAPRIKVNTHTQRCFTLHDSGHISVRDQGAARSQAFQTTSNIFTSWPSGINTRRQCPETSVSVTPPRPGSYCRCVGAQWHQ